MNRLMQGIRDGWIDIEVSILLIVKNGFIIFILCVVHFFTEHNITKM